MEDTAFTSTDKTFAISLNKYDCCKFNKGECPLSRISNADDILQIQTTSFPQKTEDDYCINIAKLLLKEQLKQVIIIHHEKCGHYSFMDGRHRTCVATKLKKIEVAVNLEYKVELSSAACPYCKQANIPRVKQPKGLFGKKRKNVHIDTTSYYLEKM